MRAYKQPLPWLRLWTEFATDPKTQQLSEVDQRRFIMLLCFAGSGVTPSADDSAVAFALRIPLNDALETKGRLIERRLIRATWFPVAWERRQFKSDHDAAERKRRQRRRERERHVEVTTTSRDSPVLEGEEEGSSEGDADQKQNSLPTAAGHMATPGGLRELINRQDGPLKSPPNANRESKRARNGDFEAILDRVERFHVEAQLRGEQAPDHQLMAGFLNCSERQVQVAVEQLHDRKRLPLNGDRP